MEYNTLIPSDNWLDTNYMGTSLGCNSILSYYNTNVYWWPYYVPIQTESYRPIKLTLSEIEELRKIAKANKKVKETLQKFTHMIEISVDFE